MINISHALITINTSNANNLTNTEVASKLIEDISNYLETTIIESAYHEFGPSGLTGFALLKESHIAIHSWPEENLIMLDILSCKPFKASFNQYLDKLLRASYSIKDVDIANEIV